MKRAGVLFLLLFFHNAFGYMYSDYTWYEYGGHQYAATLALGPWETVNAEAASIGANLVTINNAAENAWLSAQFASISVSGPGAYGIMWIGLYSDGQEWRWVSGEPLDYMAPVQHGPWDTPGPHMYLHTDMHPYGFVRTWNNNAWHDNNPAFYVQGIIEIPEPATLLLLGLGGLLMHKRH